MDLVFTKDGANVRLELWLPDYFEPGPPRLTDVKTLEPDLAARLVQNQRPDIYPDFLTWIAANF